MTTVAAQAPTTTVLTPTYNRAHTLHRPYESLCAQTERDFEWLIIDDGSTDGTKELVEAWQKQADFPIRYYWKENGGKHTAFNMGVKLARGAFLLEIASDDACVPHALEHFRAHWKSIPAHILPSIGAVATLARNPEGQLVGTRYPPTLRDATELEAVYRVGLRGEKWMMYRTEALREQPFPEVAGRVSHFPEATVYMRVARKYKTRYVNDELLIVHTDQASLMRPTGSRRDLNSRLAISFVPHYRIMLNEQMDYALVAPVYFYKAAAQYVRFSLYGGVSLPQQMRELKPAVAKLLWVLALPAGLGAYIWDGWRPLPTPPALRKAS